MRSAPCCLLLLLLSCDAERKTKPTLDPPPSATNATSATNAMAPAAVKIAPASPSASAAPAAAPCPPGTRRVPGGRLFMGSDSPSAAAEDRPRFETEVSDLCVDETEVTVSDYLACEQSGKCTPAKRERRFCNARVSDRQDHPINCVDWHQAKAYCAQRSARLPTEAEWEYFARGGTRNLKYSWGNEPPQGRTCWKHVGGSCKVKSYAPDVFGLYDVIGNVWEWVDDGFGPFPFPPQSAPSRGYRGGSWSRRFEKWMSPKLRNRYGAKQWGSHLGFRCVQTPEDAKCAFGRTLDKSRCAFGVHAVNCGKKQSWNGVRCAGPGAPECPEGRVKTLGHGCVLSEPATGPFEPGTKQTPISRTRSPQFDADCQKFKPGRPTAYRYSGGSHDGRNRVSAAAGCSNRDVGVGWNSTCCP
ncbi:MAG TPA: SUMF1/EgtB/PvdO family nonheme iron enzyme [Polyangiaceae bacterium]|nr:SUMF1/EgtB/PvdO family nonheme iron enzyme [Polyangiaceae bacterium]